MYDNPEDLNDYIDYKFMKIDYLSQYIGNRFEDELQVLERKMKKKSIGEPSIIYKAPEFIIEKRNILDIHKRDETFWQ